jgi:hypothetical protein
VIQVREYLALGAEALHGRWLAGMSVQKFNGGSFLELRICAHGLIHRAHAPQPDQPCHLPWPDPRAEPA